MDAYVHALVKEIEGYREKLKGYLVKTVFFGGGTPSILSLCQIQQIMESLHKNFMFTKAIEQSIEVNPGTIHDLKLRGYRELGMNRLSFGLQSTNDSLLKKIGRVHSYRQFEQNFKLAREIGFENISLDLMFSLPDETMEDLGRDLTRILSLRPDHISAYSLTLAEHTKMYTFKQENRYHFPDDEEDRGFYHLLCDTLSANGYPQYEISNFGKKKCLHNLTYWRNEDYVGIGAAAHSCFSNTRYHNISDIKTYIQGSPYEGVISLSQADRLSESLFLGLRLLKGVDIRRINKRFNIDLMSKYQEVIQRNLKDGLVEVVENHLRLTRRGLDLANVVMSDFV